MRWQAFILVLALICAGSCPTVQACMGGESHQTYIEEDMAATAGNYTAKQFKISREKEDLAISVEGSGRLLILNKTEMNNLKEGKPFDSLWPGGNYTMRAGRLEVVHGEYWAVLSGLNSKNDVAANVYIYRPADMCATVPMLPEGIQFGGMAVVLISAFAVSLWIKKRYA